MKVEVLFDFMCPFCYIGEAKFKKVLEAFEHKDAISGAKNPEQFLDALNQVYNNVS